MLLTFWFLSCECLRVLQIASSQHHIFHQSCNTLGKTYWDLRFYYIVSMSSFVITHKPSSYLSLHLTTFIFWACRFEGFRGFYRGITPNMLKNVPAASITFIVYENVLNMLKYARRKDWDLYFSLPSILLVALVKFRICSCKGKWTWIT